MTYSIYKRLSHRRVLGNIRKLSTYDSTLVDLASYDYLGLSKVPVTAVTFPGATGSRLLAGNSWLVEKIEEEIAAFHGYKTATLFTCGYMANIGLLAAITSHEDVIVYDAAIHASCRDGMKLSRAPRFAFRHNDLNHLERRLQKISTIGSVFVLIESIYSQDGSQAPLREIVELTQRYGAYVIVDEAHSIGICGPQGRGIVASLCLQDQVLAVVVTLTKALSTIGAMVLSSKIVQQAVINFSTSYIYTSALSENIVHTIKERYEQMVHADDQRKQLREVTDLFCTVFGYSSTTHIQNIMIPGNMAVKQAASHLQESGFCVFPLMSPTVARGHEVLRICLHSYNTKKEIEDFALCCRTLSLLV